MVNEAKIRLALLFLILCGTGVAWPMTIAENGQARVTIVVAAEASEPEHYAARELADFLKQITGAEFEIVDKTRRRRSCIFVGSEAAKAVYRRISTETLGAEGIVIKTAGGSLVLAGGQPRGTLYAVYTFLEDQLGCRWWSSTESTIPKKPTVEIGEIDVHYLPMLEYREPFWFDAFDGNWAVRNKCNGNGERLSAKQGGKHQYEGFVHTYYSLIPPDKYFATHPEWFSLIDGKRTYERAQLCLTNEEMQAELLKNLKEQLRKHPEATIASVSQNDWYGNCQCLQCAAVEKEEESPAGLVLRFANMMAEKIESEFPTVAISTLAYQYTRKPPKTTRPRDNVIVRLCSIECSFSASLAAERNKPFRDDIVGWSKICKRLYVWDYTTNFRHYVMPHPNLRVLGPNVRFFADHNVTGLFEQGGYNTNGAEMAELRAWVLAKLLWAPYRDAEALIDEFITGYYGPAGPHIKAYLDVTHDAVEKSGDWLGCFEKYTAQYLSFETLSEGWKHLREAEAAVRDNPELRFRVQVAQLPTMYTIMMRWDEMKEAAEKAQAEWPMADTIERTYDAFMEIAKKKNVTRLNEWQPGFGVLDDAVKRAER